MVGDIPITRYWLIPSRRRPKMFTPHPSMSTDEIRARTQKRLGPFLQTASHLEALRTASNRSSARVAFMFISKLYRQMYANTGISTDSARRKNSNFWARWIAKPCRKLFQAKPMPDLRVPDSEPVLLPIIG